MRASEELPGRSLRAVFRTIDITPGYPVSLLGYFNNRVSAGVLDPLYCRLAAFAGEGLRPARAGERCRDSVRAEPARRLLFVQIDTCLIENGFAWLLRRALRRPEGGRWAEREVLLFVNHTHTAPALMSLYEVPREERYAEELLRALAAEAGAAARGLAETSASERAPA